MDYNSPFNPYMGMSRQPSFYDLLDGDAGGRSPDLSGGEIQGLGVPDAFGQPQSPQEVGVGLPGAYGQPQSPQPAPQPSPQPAAPQAPSPSFGGGTVGPSSNVADGRNAVSGFDSRDIDTGAYGGPFSGRGMLGTDYGTPSGMPTSADTDTGYGSRSNSLDAPSEHGYGPGGMPGMGARDRARNFANAISGFFGGSDANPAGTSAGQPDADQSGASGVFHKGSRGPIQGPSPFMVGEDIPNQTLKEGETVVTVKGTKLVGAKFFDELETLAKKKMDRAEAVKKLSAKLGKD